MTNTKLIIKGYIKDLPIGKVADADCKRIKEEMNTYIEVLGNEIYHLGEGRITGTDGWNLSNK